MKTTLKACPNITKRDLMTALMDGRTFSTYDVHDKLMVIHWDNNYGDCPVRHGLNRWNWRGFKNLHEIVEQKWYEDPDMVGKPVKVCNNDTDWQFDKFICYEKHTNPIWPFTCATNGWRYCEPLTPADLYQGEV